MIPIIDSVLGIIEKFVPDQEKSNDIKKELMKHEAALEDKFLSYANKDMELRLKEIESTGFKAMWRPVMMFSFCAIVVLYCLIYYILPGILVYFPMDYEILEMLEPIPVDPALWDLVKYSILGIAGMRTIDKARR